MLSIKIKVKSGINFPAKATNGDWIDLYTSDITVLKANEYAEIPLGVAMELPRGWEAIIAPRSSTFKHFGCLMANSIGIIDETYNGNNDYWCFPVYATKDIIIPRNTRICQFRIIEHQPMFMFQVVNNLENNDRGGLGSTGIK